MKQDQGPLKKQLELINWTPALEEAYKARVGESMRAANQVTVEDLLQILILEHGTLGEKVREELSRFLSNPSLGRIAQAISDAGI